MIKKQILIIGLFIAVISFFNLTLQKFFIAYAKDNEVLYEETIYCDITLENEFDDDSVIVVMDKYTSGINKQYPKAFFGDIGIKSIKDLTKITGKVEDKKYLDTENFRQILQIQLLEKSKENVLSVIKKLEKIDGVLSVAPNNYQSLTLVAEDEYYEDLWGLNSVQGIQADLAWNITTGSSEVKVGIIDSGISNHIDLNGNLGEGWDFFSENNITSDDINGHGTHIAGTIGATGNNSEGIVGVNQNITLIPLQIGDWAENGEYLLSDEDISEAIIWAADNNIPILNFSIGSCKHIPIENALNIYKGLFVCAAGNGEEDNNGDYIGVNNDITTHYPSDYADETNFNYSSFNKRIISVGSLKSNNERSSFSNYGITSVSIYAPGEGILSTVPTSICDNICNKADIELTDLQKLEKSTHQYYGYHNYSGTSMATPHVVGTAALMLSINPSLTAIELKKAILDNADEITISTTDGTQVVKKLNAYRAVQSVQIFEVEELTPSTMEITRCKKTLEGDIIIPSGYSGKEIVSIKEGAFKNQELITSIIIPNTVTHIGASAFSNCCEITEIVIPNSVTSFGFGAFSGCENLFNIELPFIGNEVNGSENTHFGYIFGAPSYNGQNDYLPYEPRVIVTGESITEYAFYDCVLGVLTLQESVTNIGDYAFANSDITFIDIKNESGFEMVGDYAFVDCQFLRDITLSDSITTLGMGAFSGCTNLSTVNLAQNNSLTKIGDMAFYECVNLSSFVIPSTVTELGACAFEGCLQLTSINIPNAVEKVGSSVFHNTGFWNNAQDNSIVYAGTWCLGYKGVITNATIQTNTKGIADGAFRLNSDLLSVSLPASLLYIGEEAFWHCENLETVMFVGNSELESIGKSAFSETNIKNIIIPSTVKEIGAQAFLVTPNLTSIVIHNDVTNIGAVAINGDDDNNMGQITIYAESSQPLSGWDEYWNAFPDYAKIFEDIENGTYDPENSERYYQRRPVFWGCGLSEDKTYVEFFEKTDMSITDSDAPNGINDPYREGYVFEGWSKEGNSEERLYTSAELVTAPNDIYHANWTEIATYTIVYVDEDNQILDTRLWQLPTEHTYGTQTVLKNASREGYSFEGWYTSNDETGIKITTIPALGYNHNITLYAKWEVETYSITYRNVTNEYMEMNPPLFHTYGVDTPLYSADMEGYTFAGWATNSEHEGPLLSYLSAYEYTEDITLYPVWISNSGMCEVYYVNYLLVTDCSDENYRENYFKEYEFTETVLVGAPYNNIILDIESYLSTANYTGILIFATEQELIEEIISCGLTDTMFDIPCVVATTALSEDGSMEVITFMRDHYSIGYNIASTYVDSLTGNNVEIMGIVQAVYEEYGYFPIIADDNVKYNTMLLLGLSDVFGVPVKIFGEGEIMNIVAGENSFNLTEHLLFIEPTYHILDLFDGIWNLSTCYFFGYDEDSIAQCLLVSEHVYAIRERVRYLCVIIESFEDGIPLNEDDYYSWTFDAVDKWGALGYTMEDSSVQDGYINYWSELGYTIDENGWDHYKNYVWIGNTGEGAEYDYNNIYYLEMGMVLLEI